MTLKKKRIEKKVEGVGLGHRKRQKPLEMNVEIGQMFLEAKEQQGLD